MTVKTSTRRGARALLAMSAFAIAAAVLPASAANEPYLMNTSVDGGWTAGAIAARYDRGLFATSSVVVKDAAGVALPGTTTVIKSVNNDVKDSIAWAPALPMAQGTYTVEFTAVSAPDADGNMGTTASPAKTFKLDLVQPVKPKVSPLDPTPQSSIYQPGTPVNQPPPLQAGTVPLVFGPSDVVTLSGLVRDGQAAGDTLGAFRSGIARVDVEWYTRNTNPTQTKFVRTDLPTLSASADPKFEKEFSYSPEVTTGYYTLKIFAVDAAGRRSAPQVLSLVKM